MKYLIGSMALLLIACLAAVWAVVMAEEGTGAADRAAKVAAEIGLSGQEAADVAAILEIGFQRQEAIRSSYAGSDDPEARRSMAAELRESREQTRVLLEGMLSAEQMQKLDATLAPRGGRPGGGQRMDELMQALQLSDEQRGQVEPILADAEAQRRELMQGMRGSGSGAGFGAMRGTRDKMRSLDKELRNQLEAVLTKEQLETFDDWREQRRAEMRQRMKHRRGGF